MANYSGVLNKNIIQSVLCNMIISQDVLGGSIKHNYSLVEKARVDGSLYGDTKLYIDTPTLTSSEWGNDAEASNLLALHRPAAPAVQGITFGVYRQVALTTDDYLSKQAFMDEGGFSTYNAILMSRLSTTKEIYDNTTYNAFFGTVKGGASINELSVALSGISATGEEKNRLEAQTIAQSIADLIDDMKDYSTAYTENGFLRAFGEDEIKIVWNKKFVNKITKIDLPTIFHKDGLLEKGAVLPERYFGSVNSGATAGDGVKVRSLIEQVIGSNHYWAGDLIKKGDNAPAGTSYTVDDSVICKVVVKLPPYMSAFSVGTSFFNAKSLTTNNYLTFGHNKLEALKAFPIITVKAA